MRKTAKPRDEWSRPELPPPLDYPHGLNTLPESAAFLRKPVNTVRDYVARGVLASKKVGRGRLITRTELLRFAGVTAADLSGPKGAA